MASSAERLEIHFQGGNRRNEFPIDCENANRDNTLGLLGKTYIKERGMKYRPSRLFLICIVPMLLSGVAGALVWKKFNSVPMSVRAQADFFEILKYKEPQDFDMPTPEQLARTRHVVEDLISDLTREFPNLAAASHPVPDDENAFLQLYLLGGSSFAGPQLSAEFQEMLKGEAALDAEAARRCLEEHAEFVSRIEDISLMESCSSNNMPDDYIGFIAARVPYNGTSILLLKARLAAEAGDEDEVLRLVMAAANLGSHYRKIENPNLLSETIAVLIDLTVRDITFKHLLPALGKDADLVRWKEALNHHQYTPASYAEVLRGEWFIGSRYMLYPIILDPSKPNAPKDGENLARAHAANFSFQIESIRRKQLADLLTYDGNASNEFYRDLSEESREIADIFMIGTQSWAKGFVRAAMKVAQYDAAMELLILERKEGSIGAEDSEGVVTNPINGKAFEYDAVTRKLSAPPVSEDQEVETLVLPSCS
jgi:hypothetical protein